MTSLALMCWEWEGGAQPPDPDDADRDVTAPERPDVARAEDRLPAPGHERPGRIRPAGRPM